MQTRQADKSPEAVNTTKTQNLGTTLDGFKSHLLIFSIGSVDFLHAPIELLHIQL
jgi:hypothetical protein